MSEYRVEHLIMGDWIEANSPPMTCPNCGKVSPDLDGFGVLSCDCGYCTHSAVSDGVCDFCGKETSDES